jgi:hypothetical protein
MMPHGSILENDTNAAFLNKPAQMGNVVALKKLPLLLLPLTY